MSYSFINSCYVCAKKDACGDYKKVQDAITAIHTSTDGSHQGSGSVVLSCSKMVTTIK